MVQNVIKLTRKVGREGKKNISIKHRKYYSLTRSNITYRSTSRDSVSYKIRSHNDYVAFFEKVPIKVDISIFYTPLVPIVKSPRPCVGYQA